MKNKDQAMESFEQAAAVVLTVPQGYWELHATSRLTVSVLGHIVYNWHESKYLSRPFPISESLFNFYTRNDY